MKHLKGDMDRIPFNVKIAQVRTSYDPSFHEIDVIFYNETESYFIQMTLSTDHKPECSQNAWNFVQKWIKQRVKCSFVVLTDSRTHQDDFVKMDASMLVDEVRRSLDQYVGVLIDKESNKPALFRFTQIIITMVSEKLVWE
jgi:hypothetical protein